MKVVGLFSPSFPPRAVPNNKYETTATSSEETGSGETAGAQGGESKEEEAMEISSQQTLLQTIQLYTRHCFLPTVHPASRQMKHPNF